MPAASPYAELKPGVWVRIGDCVCQIRKPLGLGSFGAVWAAERHDGFQLAVKEIHCGAKADVLNALFEGHLLRLFGGDGGAGNPDPTEQAEDGAVRRGCCSGCVPSLLASETLQTAPDNWLIRLAMGKISGVTLDDFLSKRRKLFEECGACSPKGLIRLIRDVDRHIRELIMQLARAFEHISACTYHRDVNAHNILIDTSDPSNVIYGLVDFGLAVDAASWQMEQGSSSSTRPSRIGQDGQCTWHHLDVGGDCRYWPVSAWVQFLLGCDELQTHSSLCFEYQTKLDLHSLGMTALQCIVEMLPLPTELAALANAGPEQLEGCNATVLEIYGLSTAWEQYWETVSPLHDRLMDTFHRSGDWDGLKIDCIDRDVHGTVAEQLRTLRCSIRKTGEACASAPEAAGLGGFQALLEALLLMISTSDTKESSQGPRRWSDILRHCCPLGDFQGLRSTCQPAPPLIGHAESPGVVTHPAVFQGSPSSPKPVQAVNGLGRDDLSVRLTQLKGKMDSLAEEMKRIGEKRDELAMEYVQLTNASRNDA